MLKFYKDRKQTFKCKVKVEGKDKTLKDAKVRLVFEDGNIQRFYPGMSDVLGNCVVELPSLKDHEQDNGNVVLEVRIDDIVFEPYKTKYQLEKSKMEIIETSVSNKRKLFQKNVSKEDVLLVKQMLEGYGKIDKKNKVVLKEYIELKYKPSDKIKKWASKIFKDLDNMKARIVMYEAENIFLNK